ncbi:MAG TPA: CocE/NonD family hydrolase, partial [Myxococcota bacterium]|nr:CocE/NonD family hydrolase [Myxococcota bacterium]
MNPRSFLVAAIVLLAPLKALAVYETSVMVPMSDGVNLYADLVMPDASGGPFPVILARTPYTDLDAQQGMIRDALDMIVNLGFATMIQHTRGAGLSEGGGLPFFHDRADGQDTLD